MASLSANNHEGALGSLSDNDFEEEEEEVDDNEEEFQGEEDSLVDALDNIQINK